MITKIIVNLKHNVRLSNQSTYYLCDLIEYKNKYDLTQNRE